LFFLAAPTYSLEPAQVQPVQHFIDCIKTRNIPELFKLMPNGLRRRVPIPPISSQKDLAQRFDEVFDPALVQMIVHSDIQKDWSVVGWRGIMFENGLIWLSSDAGKIECVNYQSDAEKKKWEYWVRLDKEKLYPTLRHYSEPVLEWETTHFHIRIDSLSNEKFRYAVWKAGKSTSSKPDLVLNNGVRFVEGTMDLTYYVFKNRDTVYIVFYAPLGGLPDDAPTRELRVCQFKGEVNQQNFDEKILEKAALFGEKVKRVIRE